MTFTGHVYFEGLAPRRTIVTRPRSAPRGMIRIAPPSEPERIDDFVSWLFGEAGLQVDRYRGRSLSRRLPACLRFLRASTVDEARRMLHARPELVNEALDVLLLGVTQFFRDVPVFACLRDRVLPELTEGEKRIRVWSAACSEGQELYSVALMLHARRSLERSEMLGTDLRASAIARAENGSYAPELLDQLEPDYRRAFEMRDGRAAIASSVRQAIQWRRQDLFETAAAGPWDLILWRNMAIYLARSAIEDVWRRIWQELRPGGFCVTGKAEQPPRELAWARVGPCVYRKLEGPSS